MTTNIEIAKRIMDLYYPLSKDSLRAFANILIKQKCKKGERILDQDEICTSMLFIEKGMTRQFYFKYNKDLTEHIGYEDGMIICIESFFNQEPTRLMVETLESSVLWRIPKDKLEALSSQYIDIGVLYRKFLEKSLIISQEKADLLRFESAQVRYTKLMQHHPEILKRASLVCIASYLQMSPETLSRVRGSQ